MLTLGRLLQQPELELTLLVDGDSVARDLLWLHNTDLPGDLVLTNSMRSH